MGKGSLRVLLASVLAIAALLLGQSVALGGSGPSVRGGGVVGGPLGVTSQLGFTATSAGGSFLCVMAGRSGGFAFPGWASVSQMEVQGRVTPGTLAPSGGGVTFSGMATIRIVGKTAAGDVLTATLRGVPFDSWQTAGGVGVARHTLVVNHGELIIGPALLGAGRITITQ